MKEIKQLYKYIQSDFVRYGGNPTLLNILTTVLLGKNHCFSFSFWFRLGSKKYFLHNC